MRTRTALRLCGALTASAPSRAQQPAFPISAGDFTDWKQKNDVFEDVAASFDNEVTLTGSGEPKLVLGYDFTPNYFRILRVSPRIGRTFGTPNDSALAWISAMSAGSGSIA